MIEDEPIVQFATSKDSMPAEFKHTDVGMIPQEWDVVELWMLIDESRGIRYGIVQPGKYDPNGRLMVRGQDYSKGWVSSDEMFRVSAAIEERYKNARLRSGDLIITIVGAGTGHVEAVPEWLNGANLTQTTARIAIDERTADRIYCMYVLQSRTGISQVESFIKGGAQPGLNCGDVEKFQVPLAPLPEQQAIAAALSDADALIASLEKLIAKKRDMKAAAMQQLLTGSKRLPGFSGMWEIKEWGDVFQFLATANNSRGDLSDHDDVKYIHYGDIHTSSASTLDCASALLPFIDGDKVRGFPFVEDGDVVMADASEDYDGIGKSVEIRNATGMRVVAGLHTFLMRSDRHLLADGFKGYLQFIPSIKAALVRAATGISVFGISKNNLRKIAVPLPSIEEQRAIAAVLSDMDAEITALEARRDKMRAIKQGMMQELLTGRIRLV
jgi:type I restriction enzyme S subunit